MALLAAIAVHARSLIARMSGHGDTGGLTTPCRGCDEPSPHDAHLAWGALAYLGRHAG